MFKTNISARIVLVVVVSVHAVNIHIYGSVSWHHINISGVVLSVISLVINYRVVAVVIVVLENHKQVRSQDSLQGIEAVVIPAVRVISII